jgi:hypothetical protein
MTQQGSYCTGHALAGVIHAELARHAERIRAAHAVPHVSSYMLYHVVRARRIQGWFNTACSAGVAGAGPVPEAGLRRHSKVVTAGYTRCC